MELVEIRDLDGPNLFELRPAIKLEVVLKPGQALAAEGRRLATEFCGHEVESELLPAFRTTIRALHRAVSLPEPEVGFRALDQPGHHAVHFPWQWRSVAMEIGAAAFALLNGNPQDPVPALRRALAEDRENDDRPEWVTDAERKPRSVAVTGTNGKTTTTRLLAHIARSAGTHTGWSSSTGVYIDGEEVLSGDYSGPSGAQRVLRDPKVEVAVLESARGGILRRGLAYQSSDVGVFLNVSADHLGTDGVETLETLCDVKSVVVRATRPDGLVVLNADDPRVLAVAPQSPAPVLLISRSPDSKPVAAHLAAGGDAVLQDGERIVVVRHGERSDLLSLAEVPLTFGGAAEHMVENALAATGAALGLGFRLDEIARGLQTFRPDPADNPGRLNVFRLDGRTVVIDYAHNERGLETLLAFGRRLLQPGGEVVAIIGTAGDRPDEIYRSLGRIAGREADRVYLKENPGYLRGREPGSAIRAMKCGLVEAGAEARLAGDLPDEQTAVRRALDDAREGTVIAVMCVEDQEEVLRDLERRGAQQGGGPQPSPGH